jgi:hypothetical protein
MVNCQLCGTAMAPGETFCSGCGNHTPRLTTTRAPTGGEAPHTVDYAADAGRPEAGQGAAAAPATPSPRASCRLVLADGAQFELDEKPRALGREDFREHVASTHLGLISRAHLTIYRSGNVFVIEDGETPVQPKRSANRTWLRRPDESATVAADITGRGPQPLKGGEEVDLAHAITMRVVVE